MKMEDQATIASTRTSGNAETKTVHAKDLNMTALDIEQPATPQLQHGLERALFNPGVYHLQDPRSRVYNFDPCLQEIMPAAEFDFAALKEYTTSSKDGTLESIA